MTRTGKRGAGREEMLENIKALLLDIEGTTTSISFVKDTLFSYVRANLKKYIDDQWENEEFKADLQKLREQAKADEEKKLEGCVPISADETKLDEIKESLEKNILWQMDRDRKTDALKQLQGHMWREAYNSGQVKAHVYDDVPKAFEEWTSSGKKLYIYSSGSVEAQKLLFGFSKHGDLKKFLSDYFDTGVGQKQDAESYKSIATKIGFEPSTILFLTDVVKEAEAAKAAGLSTAIVIRDGNVALTEEQQNSFTCIESFSELVFEVSSKRQKIENEDEIKAQESNEIVKTLEKSEPIVEAMDTSESIEVNNIDEKKCDEVSKVDETEVKLQNGNSTDVKSEGLKGEDIPKAVIQDETTKKDEMKVEESKGDSPDTETEKVEIKNIKESEKKIEPVASEDPLIVTDKVLEQVSPISDAENTEAMESDSNIQPIVEEDSPTIQQKTMEKENDKVDIDSEEKDNEKSSNLEIANNPENNKENVENSGENQTCPKESSETPKLEPLKESEQKVEPNDCDSTKKHDETKEKEPLKSVELENTPKSEVKENDTDIKVKTVSEETKVDRETNGNSSETEKSNGHESNGKSENENKEAAQNGNSESNVESVKVKKVLETPLTEGVAETDVITPPVVAATS